ncbi:thioredoxin domain-containing protein [Candidatus Nanohalobium constans]|uniref:DSBA oxidoreductase DsbA n=1 Tax=Candidatus Nanohalobium constans TaxID=2565781 RepID=A0A5Q0UG92_9ARCH|nr:thioredoxin domain-containing protein [Candidatus Nanohalobium constans]QGA79975.1 DSBA oxidoreductase DsbA [Candidatus Nanohalobium constans]
MSYECDECGEEFDTERGLHIHQSQTHEEDEKNTENGGSRDAEEDNHTGNGITLTTSQFGIGALVVGLALGFAVGISFNQVTGSLDTTSDDSEGEQSPTQISGSPGEVMEEIAGKVGADKSEFASCMNSADGSEAVEDRNEASSALGRVGTPTFLIGNSETGFEKLEGAQPFSSMQPVIEEQLSEAESSSDTVESDEYSLENMSLDDEPSKGESDASIRVIEVSDFACPWCAEWAGFDAIPSRDIDKRNSWSQLKENYVSTGEVEFIYKDYPAHRNSGTAHQAANCVQEQGDELYWKFHDKLYEFRDSWVA